MVTILCQFFRSIEVYFVKYIPIAMKLLGNFDFKLRVLNRISSKATMLKLVVSAGSFIEVLGLFGWPLNCIQNSVFVGISICGLLYVCDRPVAIAFLSNKWTYMLQSIELRFLVWMSKILSSSSDI